MQMSITWLQLLATFEAGVSCSHLSRIGNTSVLYWFSEVSYTITTLTAKQMEGVSEYNVVSSAEDS